MSPRRVPWVTLAVVGVALLVSIPAGVAESLEYDRRAVAEGQIWRLLSGQVVHWTPRMAFVDLAVLLALGAWLEFRSRRALVVALAAAAGFVAAGVHLLAPDLAFYRGSSGLGTALFAAGALMLILGKRRGWMGRGIGWAALLLLGAKCFWEMREGEVLAAGRLPGGVGVTPIAHLLGGLAGIGAALALPERKARDSDVRKL